MNSENSVNKCRMECKTNGRKTSITSEFGLNDIVFRIWWRIYM